MNTLDLRAIQEQLDTIKAKLPLNEMELETECANQPLVYEEIGGILTEVEAHAKIAKNTVDFVWADTSTSVRNDPIKFGIPKVTEEAVKNAVTASQAYQQAQKDLIEIERLAKYIKVLLVASEQRKSSLNNLVMLYVHNYYGAQQPKMQEGVGGVTEEDIINARKKNSNLDEEIDECEE
jgi:hypothetical protein